MKALMRKMPRPDPRRMFSGANGSGTLSGSSPGPWSAMRIISESDVVSNEAVICLLVSYELPCNTAFTAASRTAMAICGIVSSSNPARCATCSAVSSILLTLSRDESRVKLTRLVVESAKDVLVVPVCRSSASDNGCDGSVLVDFSKVKVTERSFPIPVTFQPALTRPAPAAPIGRKLG
jgi:hypothetical protein